MNKYEYELIDLDLTESQRSESYTLHSTRLMTGNASSSTDYK